MTWVIVVFQVVNLLLVPLEVLSFSDDACDGRDLFGDVCNFVGRSLVFLFTVGHFFTWFAGSMLLLVIWFATRPPVVVYVPAEPVAREALPPSSQPSPDPA